MKIGILTFHCAHNYGAVLQCYGLQEALKAMGHDVQVIDYRPDYLWKPYKVFNIQRFRTNSLYELLKLVAKETILLPNRIKRHRAFDDFIKKRFNLSHSITQQDIPSCYDVYVMGSDQIWNPKITKGFDQVYFGYFSFQKANKKYVAYAASMESTKLEPNSINFLLKSLNNFDAISVREMQLAEQLHSLTGKKIETVLDPTLLVDHSIWNKIAIEPLKKKGYVLVYQIRMDTNVMHIADSIANQLNTHVIEITGNLTFQFNNRKRVQYASPEEFLGLIKNAACILTTSFHGTAFSVIFNRPFYCIALNDGYDTRSQSLLASIGLEHRIIGKNDMPVFSTIDYDNGINDCIMNMRAASMQFLQENL